MNRNHWHVLLLLLALATVTEAGAQARFKVLAVRGKVMVGSKAVTLGQQLKTSDKVVVPSSGYVSLAHVNGRTMELRKAGTFSVADLDKAASKKTGSATDKFAAYVLSELTEVKEPVSFTDDRRSQMKTTGAVDRAAGNDVQVWDSVLAIVGGPGELQALAVVQTSAVQSGSLFSVIMPRHTRLIGDTVAFVWHQSPKANSYKVVIVDARDQVVFFETIADTMLIRDLATLKLMPGSVYYWHVESASDASYRTDEYALYPLAGDERSSTESVISQIAGDLDPEQEAIGQLILASAFEEMGLTYDAHRAYSNAMNMAPDVQNYKRLFAEFLRRQGLNIEAYVAYR